MYEVRFNKYWGKRFQDTFPTLFFSIEPSKSEILYSFKEKLGEIIYEGYDEPGCSGMVQVRKIEVVF